MIGWLLRTALRLFVVSGALYVVFFVKLGERTLYEHFERIAATREAEDLKSDIHVAVGEAETAVTSRLAQASSAATTGRSARP
jgi:hypothetical protein